MDATCNVQDSIHVFHLVHNMCPGFWVHIKAHQVISVLPEFPPEDSDFDPPPDPQAASARRAAPATNEHNTFFIFM